MAGRKRHLLVDSLGLIWGLAVLAARPTDWDGAVEVFERVGRRMPRLAVVLADHAYRAKALAAWIKEHCGWRLEASGKRPGQVRFEPAKWRWIVERTFGWLGRYRRLSRGYEHNPAGSEAWIFIAMIHRMSRSALPERNKDEDLMRRPPKRQKCSFLDGLSGGASSLPGRRSAPSSSPTSTPGARPWPPAPPTGGRSGTSGA